MESPDGLFGRPSEAVFFRDERASRSRSSSGWNRRGFKRLRERGAPGTNPPLPTYLIAQGVPAAELTAVGYGKTKPIADNNSAEGRAKNRRVVMVVLDNPGDITVEGGGDPQ